MLHFTQSLYAFSLLIKIDETENPNQYGRC